MKSWILIATLLFTFSTFSEVVKYTTSVVTVVSNNGKQLVVKNEYNQKFKIKPSQVIKGKATAGKIVRIKEEVKLDRYNTKIISKKRLKKAKIKQVKNLIKTYQDFLVEVQDSYKYPSPQVDMKSFSYQIFEFFDNKAFASNGTCFFGGWESEKAGNYCQAPWRLSDPKYNSEVACGHRNLFRCNPLLFGTPSSEQKEQTVINEITFDASPPKNPDAVGFCVNVNPNGYRDVTKKCKEVSEENLSTIAKDLVDNPAKLEEFKTLQEKVASFCEGNDTYNACADLTARVAAIDQQITVETTPELTCEVLKNDAFEVSAEEANQCPRAVLMKCTGSDNNHFTGYLDQSYAQKANDHAVKFEVGSTLTLRGKVPTDESIAAGDMNLKDKPCGDTDTTLVGNGQCINIKNPSSNIIVDNNSKQSDCSNNVCRYTGECEVNSVMKKVSFVCACGIEQNESGEIPGASLCASFPLRKRIPSNYNDYSSDQQDNMNIER